MALEKILVCPICKGSEFAEHVIAKDYTASAEEFNIVKCRSCELGITTPRPNAESIGKYYESESYISHTGGGVNLADILYRQARSYMHAQKKKVIHKFNSSGSILDFGCGTGEFLHYMGQHGWTTIGIEPTTAARAKAKKNNPGIGIYESLTATELPIVNAITLWHVAEHLHQLNETIVRLKDLMHQSATLFLAVPNYQSPDAAKYKKHWAGYDVPRHLWHFSKTSMEQLVRKHGMKIVDIQPMILDAFYISFVSEQYLHPNSSKIQALAKGIIEGWKSNQLAKSNINYSSLLYVVQK